MVVQLLNVEGGDMQFVDRWLQADHVRLFWGDPGENLRLIQENPMGVNLAIIEADGRKVGLILWQHPSRRELDEAGLDDLPTGIIDIDIMIGEIDATGKGVGSAAIRLVAEDVLSDPAVPFVIAATSVDNVASFRAFMKAGFRRDREFDDPGAGRYILMVRRRP